MKQIARVCGFLNQISNRWRFAVALRHLKEQINTNSILIRLFNFAR